MSVSSGFVWGPLSVLTYWSLQEYDHVAEISHGRKMMVKQLSTMQRHVWEAHRHVCENYTPHKNKNDGGGNDGNDCTGKWVPSDQLPRSIRFYCWAPNPQAGSFIIGAHSRPSS